MPLTDCMKDILTAFCLAGCIFSPVWIGNIPGSSIACWRSSCNVIWEKTTQTRIRNVKTRSDQSDDAVLRRLRLPWRYSTKQTILSWISYNKMQQVNVILISISILIVCILYWHLKKIIKIYIGRNINVYVSNNK